MNSLATEALDPNIPTRAQVPFNIQLMNVKATIERDAIPQVSSSFIRESSSSEFHKQGLFSEEIFGQLTSTDRLIKFGYIDMHTTVFHPRIYKIITRLKGFYEEVMAGKSYAIYDPELKDLVWASVDDIDEKGARTGFTFFLEIFPKLELRETASRSRSDKLEVLLKYKTILTMDKCLVIPAGIRDVKNDNGQESYDDINKLYHSLLNYAAAIPITSANNPLFDSVRYAVQKKLVMLDEYLENFVSGKTGFFQKKYGARNVALGTRNVISAAPMAALTPTDPRFLKLDEVKVPLFQAAKGFQPLVIYFMKMLFFNQIFSQSSDQVGVIDPDTYDLVYQPIPESEKSRFLSSDGLTNLINIYRNVRVRNLPIRTISDENKKFYYLFLVYDDGDTIYHFRSKSDFIKFYGEKFDIHKLRPMTYVELLYVATYRATYKKHAIVTRYPVIEIGSEYPAAMHLISTDPAKAINYKSIFADMSVVLPEYPIVGNRFVDSAILHPSRLAGMDADYDGDMVSVNPVLSVEANKECATYLNSARALIKPSGKLYINIDVYLINLVMYNCTRAT